MYTTIHHTTYAQKYGIIKLFYIFERSLLYVYTEKKLNCLYTVELYHFS